MTYSSHEFVPLLIDPLFRRAYRCVCSHSSSRSLATTLETRPMTFSVKQELQAGDYPFRPKALEMFPLYFFIAGCTTSRSLNKPSMDWEPLEEDGVRLHQRSYSSDPIKSRKYPDENLVDPDDVTSTLHRYSFYVTLRMDSSWRAPIVWGITPRAPGDGASAVQEGKYGLFMMLLFRPFRSIPHFVADVILGGTRRGR